MARVRPTYRTDGPKIENARLPPASDNLRFRLDGDVAAAALEIDSKDWTQITQFFAKRITSDGKQSIGLLTAKYSP